MPEYVWILSRQAAERLVHLPARERRSLIDAFDRIPSLPPDDPNAHFQDGEGIDHYMVQFRAKIITYKIDDAVCRIEILAIE